MADRLYNQQINKYYLQPENIGSLDINDISVGSALVGTPDIGMVMKLQIQVQDGVIQLARNKIYGCGAAIATGSYVTDKLQGLSLTQALAIDSLAISQALSLPPVKMYCAIMAQDAIKTAIKDYQIKNT